MVGKTVPAGSALRYWADDLAGAFVQLEPRKIAELPFQGTISRTEAAPVRISRVTATKHRVLRLRSHIARSKDDLCFINLQLEGIGQYNQRGHQQVCRPGDLAIVDTTEPFEIANNHNFQLFCFAVPRHLLPDHISDRPRLPLSVTEAGRALSRTLRGYAELCLSAQVPAGIATLASAHIVDLVSHANGVFAEGLSDRTKAPVILSIMLDYIGRHTGDPGLSAATLAQEFHCSERYVHKLFSGTGRSVGEHVNDRRIAVCTGALLDNGQDQTIAEIALAAGFRDISYFNRLFKRSHGIPPREFRRAMAVR